MAARKRCAKRGGMRQKTRHSVAGLGAEERTSRSITFLRLCGARSVFRILRTRKDAETAPVAPPITRIRTRPQISA
jgi:hypothetical protein